MNLIKEIQFLSKTILVENASLESLPKPLSTAISSLTKTLIKKDSTAMLFKVSGKKTIEIVYKSSGNRKSLIAQVEDILGKKYDTSISYTKSSVGQVEFSADNLNVRIMVKPSGKSSSADPHELMTAALILSGSKVSTPSSTADADKLIAGMKKYAKQIKGFSQKELDAFDGDYDNLAQAISATNTVLKNLGSSPVKVYITGRQWDKDIAFLNKDFTGIKNYNASDLIVRTDDEFVGVSLKKKPSVKAPDPTLINKVLEDFFKGIISESEMKKIATSKEKFFKKITNTPEGANKKELNANIKKLSNDEINAKLKSKENNFFKTVNKVLMDNSDEFIDKFLKLIFRVELKTLKEYDFNFLVVTGIGRYLPSKSQFMIDTAKAIDLDTSIETVDNLLGDKISTTFEKTRGKKQGYEKDAGAAKLFYTLYNGDDDLINMEIRYKGSFTSNPQFFAFITVNFKNMLKGVD